MAWVPVEYMGICTSSKSNMNKFLVSVPFTGLGLYGGFRGNRWLRNRIRVFETFVIPSLLAQSDRDFIVWVAWRQEERSNKYVQELKQRLDAIPNFEVVFTYSGIPFWDDKHDDDTARTRLGRTLAEALPELMDVVGDCENVYWLLQPSDDCYNRLTIQSVRAAFEDPEMQAVTFTKGYLCNYSTKELLEYNPKTNPPFFAIKYPRGIFFDPGKHMTYSGPFKSHEYIGDKLKLGKFEGRGFLVGTHGENISTHFNHPYGGQRFEGLERDQILESFGIVDAEPLKLPISIRKQIMRKLPHPIRRKLRYWFGEVLGNRLYNWLRS